MEGLDVLTIDIDLEGFASHFRAVQLAKGFGLTFPDIRRTLAASGTAV